MIEVKIMGGSPGSKWPKLLIDTGGGTGKRIRLLRYNRLNYLKEILGILSFSLFKSVKFNNFYFFDQKTATGLCSSSLFMSVRKCLLRFFLTDYFYGIMTS